MEKQLSKGTFNRNKTRCNKGHRLSGRNVQWTKEGYRQCRMCKASSNKRLRLRKKGRGNVGGNTVLDAIDVDGFDYIYDTGSSLDAIWGWKPFITGCAVSRIASVAELRRTPVTDSKPLTEKQKLILKALLKDGAHFFFRGIVRQFSIGKTKDGHPCVRAYGTPSYFLENRGLVEHEPLPDRQARNAVRYNLTDEGRRRAEKLK
jgi:hypothetical protein